MKKNNFIKRALIALTFAMAVAVMVPAVGSVEAQAAKKVTAQKNWKKAKAVKIGTTVVTVKKLPKNVTHQDAYIKFKAPKAGKYVITVSSLKIKGEKPANSVACGGYYIEKLPSGESMLLAQRVKTEGGKAITLPIGTKEMYKYSVEEGMPKVEQYLTKRSATITLKKGETIWLVMYLSSPKQYTYNLKIKRK